MASILVPISSLSYPAHSGGDFYGGSGTNSHYGGFDSGPPYIVKLTHLPLTCLDAFIEDLFASRFTPFVKFKIIVDPSSNILETGVVRKIAFVELKSCADLQKSLKWLDLYYKGNRRVAVEPAEYLDFQYCMDFNKNHQEEIAAIEREFSENKMHHRSGDSAGRGATEDSRGPLLRSGHDDNKLMNPHTRGLDNGRVAEDTTVSSVPQKPKPNPFGNAKPVDIVTHQLEIERRIKQLNSTTSITLGNDCIASDLLPAAAKSKPQNTDMKETRRQSISILKRPQTIDQVALVGATDSHVSNPQAGKSPEILKDTEDATIKSKVAHKLVSEEPQPAKATPKLVLSPNPPSVWTLIGASVLSAKPELTGEIGSRRNASGNKKPITKPVSKPVVLKKKIAPVSPEPWVPIKSIAITAISNHAVLEMDPVREVAEVSETEATEKLTETSKVGETENAKENGKDILNAMTDAKHDESNRVKESSEARQIAKDSEKSETEDKTERVKFDRASGPTNAAELANISGLKITEVNDEGKPARQKSSPFESPFSQSKIVTHTLDAENVSGIDQAAQKSIPIRTDFKTKFNELIARPFVPKEKRSTRPSKAYQQRDVNNTNDPGLSAKEAPHSADESNPENSLLQSSNWRADRKSVVRSKSPRKKERRPSRKALTLAISSEAQNALERTLFERRASFKERSPSDGYQKKAKAEKSAETCETQIQKTEATSEKMPQNIAVEASRNKAVASGLAERPARNDRHISAAGIEESVYSSRSNRGRGVAAGQAEKPSRNGQPSSAAENEGPIVSSRPNRGGRGSRLYRGGMNKPRRGRGERQGARMVE